MADIPFVMVDAFVGESSFTGNPATVVWSTEPLPDALMANVAMQLNQAETAFITGTGPTFALRWFTPTVEVDLCGHATLASAFAIWNCQVVPDASFPDTPISFETRSGVLVATQRDGNIELDFPREMPWEAELSCPIELGQPLVWTGRNRMDWFIEVDDPEAVRQLSPPFAEISALGGRGLIVTAPGDRPGIDFISRFFAPQAGVPEDAVTGSAHCALGPYWSEKLNRPRIQGFQASRRGGLVSVETKGDRCILGGRARLSGSGLLWV